MIVLRPAEIHKLDWLGPIQSLVRGNRSWVASAGCCSFSPSRCSREAKGAEKSAEAAKPPRPARERTMATQRLTVAALAGEAAAAVFALFRSWSADADPDAIDRFCDGLREHGYSLPIVYFSEWVDHWLMGDLVPGPAAVEGRRCQAACLSVEQAVACADGCGDQFSEQEWLAARLREAASAWDVGAERYAVVVVREVFGASTTDEEVLASLDVVPAWLSNFDIRRFRSGGSGD